MASQSFIIALDHRSNAGYNHRKDAQIRVDLPLKLGSPNHQKPQIFGQSLNRVSMPKNFDLNFPAQEEDQDGGINGIEITGEGEENVGMNQSGLMANDEGNPNGGGQNIINDGNPIPERNNNPQHANPNGATAGYCHNCNSFGIYPGQLPNMIDDFSLHGGAVVDIGGAERRRSSRRPPPRGGYNNPYGRCTNYDCLTKETPMWRKGPLGPKTLCNACGIKYRKQVEKRGRIRNGGHA